MIGFYELYGIFSPMMSQPVTYFSLLFMFFITSTVDKITVSIKKRLEEYYEKEEQRRLQKVREFAEHYGFARSSSLQRRKTGYAFAQEDHADP